MMFVGSASLLAATSGPSAGTATDVESVELGVNRFVVDVGAAATVLTGSVDAALVGSCCIPGIATKDP